MIKLDIIGKRIDKVGEFSQAKYLLNPLFFLNDKYLSADLYFTFKKTLKPMLKKWQIEAFEEVGVIVKDKIVRSR